MKRKNVLFLFFLLCVLCVSTSWSFPGDLQLASRPGSWANDYPDAPIFLQHIFYYQADKVWDGDGNNEDFPTIHITASFSRLVRAWHFGDHNQYQYVLEGIVPMYNISGENGVVGPDIQPAFAESGIGHPLLYTSVGWNNPDKTTHLQGALIWQLPLGDNDLMQALGSGNNHSVMPVLGVEQRMGALWFDGSVGYWHNFEDLDTNEEQRDYLEVNGALSYRLSAPLPWWIYLQSDYTSYGEGKDASGNRLGNDGFNWAIAPGLGVGIQKNMTLDIKYVMDIDGKSTLKGEGMNLRLLWVF